MYRKVNNMNTFDIPVNAASVKVTINPEIISKGTPVYIQAPVERIPVKERFAPMNIVDQSKASDDSSFKMSISRWTKAYNYVRPVKEGEEEQLPIVQDLINKGIITSITFLDEVKEEIGEPINFSVVEDEGPAGETPAPSVVEEEDAGMDVGADTDEP